MSCGPPPPAHAARWSEQTSRRAVTRRATGLPRCDRHARPTASDPRKSCRLAAMRGFGLDSNRMAEFDFRSKRTRDLEREQAERDAFLVLFHLYNLCE